MTAYRDDRTALLARLQALEQELARSQHDELGQEMRRQLAELREQVRESTAALERDRESLAEIALSVERIAAQVIGSAAPASGSAAADRSSPGVPERLTARRRYVWLALLAGGLITLCLLFYGRCRPGCGGPGYAPPTLVLAKSLPGYPHAVDPVALLPMIRSILSRERDRPPDEIHLSSIEIDPVSPQGRVDLDGPQPYHWGSITYRFHHEAPDSEPSAASSADAASLKRPRLSPPPGLSTASSLSWTVRLNREGLHIEEDLFWRLLFADKPVADPRCSLKQILDVVHQEREGLYGTASPSPSMILTYRGVWLIRIEANGQTRDLRVTEPDCVLAPEAASEWRDPFDPEVNPGPGDARTPSGHEAEP